MVHLINQRRIKDPVKHLRGSVFAKIVDGYNPLTIFVKKSIVDVPLGSKYISLHTSNVGNVITLHKFLEKYILYNFLPKEE